MAKLKAFVLMLVMVFVSPMTLAGNLDPPGEPSAGSGMPTLQDIYDYLSSGIAPVIPGSFREPTAGPGPTMKTTKEIYDHIKAEFDQCDAQAPEVISGKKFFSTASGSWGAQTGVMPNRGAVSYTPTTTNQAIAEGYHNGSGIVEGDADLVAGNIRTGAEIFGVVGTYLSSGVARTGQTIAYRAGDDGNLRKGVVWPSPRFTENIGSEADTVTDNLTGLMWAKDANADGLVDWFAAIDYCNNLNLGGHDDWRLPNIKELYSLLDFGQNDPALPSGHPFMNVQILTPYWTSTTKHSNSAHAWHVSISGGHVDSVGKNLALYHLWPVRGGQ